MKHDRRARSAEDLARQVHEQLALLTYACRSYDEGFKPAGKLLALNLRTLLHHHGQSQAALEQLGLRNFEFMDTARDLIPWNLVAECALCMIRATTGKGAEYIAYCQDGGGPYLRWSPFEDWWTNPVIEDNQRRHFSRRDLVLNIADTDGGAHVDPSLDAAYMALSRENSLDWFFRVNGGKPIPFAGPELPCVRQIAHEVLETLRAKAGDLVTFDYPAPLAHLTK